ncbi:MAG: universal stress protein [Rhodospirillales bacterium]|nr:universal stress protein [Rhodospirillales bacterium]
MFKHLLIATDGSELATKGLRQGVALAKALQARATIVTATEPWTAVVAGEMALAFPPDEYDRTAAANASNILEEANKIAETAGIMAEPLHVKDQYPAEGIVEAAKARGCDLIVMSSHGRRGLSRLFLGSQAQRVVTHTDLPVLICR